MEFTLIQHETAGLTIPVHEMADHFEEIADQHAKAARDFRKAARQFRQLGKTASDDQ